MTVTPFPVNRVQRHPLVLMTAPGLSPSGLYEVTIWRNRAREEGYLVKVPTLGDASAVVRIADEFLMGEGRI